MFDPQRPFAVTRRDISTRADVHYAAGLRPLRARYDHPNFALVPLGSLTTFVQYGTSKRATSDESGVPVLRIPNLQADGWDLSDLKYLELTPEELATYKLEKGDILFTRTNGSRDLVGKCEVFEFSGDWIFASYLIRLRLDAQKALPKFVAAFLNTIWGRRQVEHVSRQILMSNINIGEIKQLQIPLPPLQIQRTLLSELERERSTQLGMIAQANSLTTGIDDAVAKTLGLGNTASVSSLKPFAVKLGAVKRVRRFDPPSFALARDTSRFPHASLRRLDEIATINANPKPRGFDDAQSVPYVGLPECDQTRVREVAGRSYRDVKGRAVATVGDILFARIEPSVFNKKFVFVDTLYGHAFAFLSTEFYVLRATGDEVDQAYLFAMLHSSFVHSQVVGQTSGSSGRRRLPSDALAALTVPWPERTTRRSVAAKLASDRERSETLRRDADAKWISARAAFEAALLGSSAASVAQGSGR